MSILRKLGLKLIGKGYIETLKKEAVDEAYPSIVSRALEEQTPRTALVVFLEQTLDKKISEVVKETESIILQENNVIKRKAAVSKIVSNAVPELSKIEVSLISETLITLKHINAFPGI